MRRSSDQRGRFLGLGLLIVLVIMLVAVPRLMRGGEHPLAATASFDLCAKLSEGVWLPLTDKPGRALAQPPGATAAESACYMELRRTRGYGPPDREVTIFVTTHALLRREGGRGGTQRYYETFVAETRASGWTAEEVQGPWKAATYLANETVPSQTQLLAEDDGAMIMVVARGIARDDLIAFSSAVARRLREPVAK